MYLYTSHASVGKNFWSHIQNGSIIVDGDERGSWDNDLRKWIQGEEKVEIIVKDGDIVAEYRYNVNGKLLSSKTYGDIYKSYEYDKDGKRQLVYSEAFRPGSLQARIENGLWIYKATVIGYNSELYKVKIKLFTKNSRLVRVVGRYSNNVKAFDIKRGMSEYKVYRPNKTLWSHVKLNAFKVRLVDFHGFTAIRKILFPTGESWDERRWLGTSRFVTFYNKAGARMNYYEMMDNQLTGKCYHQAQQGHGRKIQYYVRGVAIDKNLYMKKTKDFKKADIYEIFKHDNAQYRAAMIEKAGGTERIKKLFEDEITEVSVNNNKSAFLYKIPSIPTKDNGPYTMLEVICPTTSTHYFLRVPPEMDHAETARLWTFGRGTGFRNSQEDKTWKNIKMHTET